MTGLEFLKSRISKGQKLPELTALFEELCREPIDREQLLFETGTFDFTDDRSFCISLIRQYPMQNSEVACQLHLDVHYPADERNHGFHSRLTDADVEGDFFRCVRSSKAYLTMQDTPPLSVDVYLDEA